MNCCAAPTFSETEAGVTSTERSSGTNGDALCAVSPAVVTNNGAVTAATGTAVMSEVGVTALTAALTLPKRTVVTPVSGSLSASHALARAATYGPSRDSRR